MGRARVGARSSQHPVDALVSPQGNISKGCSDTRQHFLLGTLRSRLASPRHTGETETQRNGHLPRVGRALFSRLVSLCIFLFCLF